MSCFLVFLIYAVPENFVVSIYTRNQVHTTPSSVSDRLVSTTVYAGPLMP